jgi:hypothetical protein
MSAPILGLSENARRLSGFLTSALQKGLSGREILDMLRRQGLGYRTSIFYQDLRILKGYFEVSEAMKFVPRDKVISDRLYAPASLKVPEKYVTVFRADIRNILTGEAKTKFFTVAHDVPLPRWVLEGMVEENFSSWTETYPEYSLETIEALTPIRGLKRVIS